MILLHGENVGQSRQKLQELIDQARAAGKNIIRLEAPKLTEASLNDQLGGADLFGSSQLIIVEELHSLPKSKRKDALLKMLGEVGDLELILYEKRGLTPTMLKKFPQAQVFEFKLTPIMWELLDNLGSPNKSKLLIQLYDAVAQNDAFVVFSMIIRQTRLLLLTKTGGKIVGPPFQAMKLSKQAQQFSTDQLLAFHQKLFKLESELKTSTNSLELAQELDLLLFRL